MLSLIPGAGVDFPRSMHFSTGIGSHLKCYGDGDAHCRIRYSNYALFSFSELYVAKKTLWLSNSVSIYGVKRHPPGSKDTFVLEILFRFGDNGPKLAVSIYNMHWFIINELSIYLFYIQPSYECLYKSTENPVYTFLL